MTKQNNMRKKIPELPLSLFCILLLCVGPALKCGLYVQQDFIGETNFYFASRCQLKIACWLGMGESIQFPLSVLGLQLARTCAGPEHATTVFVVCQSGRRCFLGAINPSLLAFPVFLPPLPRSSLSSEGRGLMKTFHLVLKVLLGGKRRLVGGWYPPLFGYSI